MLSWNSAFSSSLLPILSLKKPPSHELRGRDCLPDLRPQHCGDPSNHHTQLPHACAPLFSPRVVTSCLQTPQNQYQNLLVMVSDHEGVSCEQWVGCCCSSKSWFRTRPCPVKRHVAADGRAVRTCSLVFLCTHPFPAADPSSPHTPRCVGRVTGSAASHPTWFSEAW